ncbi:MAG: peptidoglycan-associated lipoprotein Pal [Desulfobacterales bacterium]
MRKLTVVLIPVCVVLMFLFGCSKPIVSSGPSTAYESEAQRTGSEGTGPSGLTITEEGLGSTGAGKSLSPEQAAEARKAFENEDIHFDYDSALLTPQAQEILREKARYMKENPGTNVIIEGHCDERGTNEYNLALGEQRAKMTQEFLVALGVSASRIKTVSYGEEHPLDRSNTEQAWAKNRRAHFVITT